MLVAIGATIGLTGFFGIIAVVGIIVFFVGRFIWDLIWLAWYHIWCEPRYIRWRAKWLQGMGEEARQRELRFMDADERAKVIQALDKLNKRKALAK